MRTVEETISFINRHKDKIEQCRSMQVIYLELQKEYKQAIKDEDSHCPKIDRKQDITELYDQMLEISKKQADLRVEAEKELEAERGVTESVSLDGLKALFEGYI